MSIIVCTQKLSSTNSNVAMTKSQHATSAKSTPSFLSALLKALSTWNV